MHKGYFFDKRRNMFVVRYQHDGRRIYVGQFATPLEATKAYLNATKLPFTDAVLSAYLEQEQRPKWLAPFRKLKVVLLRRYFEKQMSKWIESMGLKPNVKK